MYELSISKRLSGWAINYTQIQTQNHKYNTHLYTSFPFNITVTLPSIVPGVFKVTLEMEMDWMEEKDTV